MRNYEPTLADIIRYKPNVIFERIYTGLVSEEGYGHKEAISFIRNMAYYKYCVKYKKINIKDLPDWDTYSVLISHI